MLSQFLCIQVVIPKVISIELREFCEDFWRHRREISKLENVDIRTTKIDT